MLVVYRRGSLYDASRAMVEQYSVGILWAVEDRLHFSSRFPTVIYGHTMNCGMLRQSV